jgi:hypothetical protein
MQVLPLAAVLIAGSNACSLRQTLVRNFRRKAHNVLKLTGEGIVTLGDISLHMQLCFNVQCLYQIPRAGDSPTTKLQKEAQKF